MFSKVLCSLECVLLFKVLCSLECVLNRMCSLGVSLRQYVDHQTRAQGGGGGGENGASWRNNVELVLPNGDVYEGEVLNDLPHGEGR